MRTSPLLTSLVVALLLFGACGSSDDDEATPTTPPTEVPVAATQPAPEPTPEATATPAEPTPEGTATPLPTIAAPTVPSVASTACDRVPFSVWNADNGNKLSFGDLNQFEYVNGGASSFGSWECDGDVVSATLSDGTAVEAVYSPNPSALTVDGVAYAYNQAEPSSQE